MRTVALLLLVLTACSSGVKVTRWAGPPKYDPGAPGPIYLEVTGSESAVALMRPYLENALEKKLGFTIAPDRAPGVPALQCQVERWHQTVPQAPQQGRPPATQLTEYLQAAINLTRADGKVVSASYAASQVDFPRERALGPNDTLAVNNVRAVVQQFLADFTPDTSTLTLDWDEDASAAEGLALARRGDTAGAEAAWRKQSTAAAHYNLGLLLEANGDPAGALAEYAAAAAVSADPRYTKALEEMKKSASFAARR